jgi:predicted ArsR family transcriptional regulator
MSNWICFRMLVVATDQNLDAQLDRLSGLAEGQRRTLYAFVAGSTRPVSRDEAATAVGISRPLAAYHLDRLVQDGLLEVRFERRTGRSGPGAGRPSKLYQRSTQPVELTIPTRDYAFIADLLARAIERDTSDQAQTALRQIARDSGAASATEATGRSSDVETNGLAGLRRMLADRGYEPYEDEQGDLRLRNCPFHRLAEHHRELVCTANLAFITGIAQQTAADEPVHARLDPRPGECCVAITRQPH